MKRLIVAVSLLLAGLAGPAAAKRIPKDYRDIKTPSLNTMEVPEPQRHELANGLVVYTLEDHELPLVGGRALLRVGSIYDSMVSVGLVDTFATVLRTGGTARMDGDALDEALESRAASIETYASTDRVSVSFSSLSDDLDYVLSLYADVLRQPVFAEEKVELAKVTARSAIARRNDDPFSLTQREFAKAIYGPLNGWARQPEYDTIDNISADMLLRFHEQFIAPSEIILGVWGDFDTAELMSLIEERFGDWKGKSEFVYYPPRPAVPRMTRRQVHVIDKQDVEQANIRIGHMGVRRDHPDAYALEVLSEILGSGFSSRLFRRVRSDEGLAYFVGASFAPYYDREGLFAVYAGTRNESVKRTLSLILEEIERIRSEPVTAEELENAKEGLLNSFVFNFDSESELVARQLLYAFYDYPPDFLEKYQPGISAVTVEDVQRVAREHIKPDQFVTLVVGRTDAFDGSLETFGRVREVDISIPEPGAFFEYIHSEETHQKWAKELVDQAIEDMGGLEALKRIETLQLEWDVELQGRQGPIMGTGSRILVFPNRVRDELSLPQGQIVRVLTETTGWRMSGGSVRALNFPQSHEMEDMLRRDPIALLRRIGTGELQGKWVGAGRLGDINSQVVLVKDDRRHTKLCFHEGDRGYVGIAYRTASPSGAIAPTGLLLSDYKPFGDLILPSRFETQLGDLPFMVSTLTSVRVNEPVDDALFEAPGEILPAPPIP